MSKEKPPIPSPPVPEDKEKKIITEKEIRFLDNGTEAVPPHATDLEQVVLGALLIDHSTKDYISLLEPEVFYGAKHKLIFRAIKELNEQGSVIDILTVSNHLKRLGKIDQAGGDYYIVQLTQLISSSAHTDFHIRIILQKYVLRELIYMSRKTIFQSLHRDPDIFDLIEEIENKLASIENIAMRRTADNSEDAKEELKQKVEMQRKGISPGFPTGIFEFDEWSGGFMPRWLITIAGRPGMGKTTAILSMLIHLAIDKGIKVTFFSLEMAAKDLKYRIAASLTNISFKKINEGKITDEEWEKVNAALDAIDASSLTIIDDVNNLDKIVSTTRKHAHDGTEIFFLDYVQLVETSNKNQDETGRLTTVTRTFKSLKNELNIPFIQLAQLSRGPDQRSDHRPQLSDLKQSGSIEEDSNMVIFLYRPEYYNKDKSNLPPVPGQANPEFMGKWIVAKGRDTGLRDFDIYIDFTKTKVESFSGIHF